MKRLAVLGLCLCLLPYCGMTAYAEETNIETDGAVISVSVPNSHTLTITANVEVAVDGKKGTVFDIERLSEPVITVYPKDGEVIVKAILNGEDITDQLADGQYKLPPVYEDLILEVETKADGDISTQPTTESTSETTASTTTESKETSVTSDSGTKPGSSSTSSQSESTTESNKSDASTTSDKSNGSSTSSHTTAYSTSNQVKQSTSSNKSNHTTTTATKTNNAGGDTSNRSSGINNGSPKTGDTMPLGSISLTMLTGLIMLAVSRKRNKDK